MVQVDPTTDPGSQLYALLDLVRPPVLSEPDHRAALAYMQAGELLVTFEHICEQLYASNTPITQGIYKVIEAVGTGLGYTEPSHWRDLIPQVKD